MKKKLRRLWSRLAWLLTGLAMAGCMAQAPLADDADTVEPPGPTPVVDDGDGHASDSAGGAPLRLSAPASIVASIHELLGDSGTLTLNGEARKLVRDDVTISLPADTTADYTLSDAGGTIIFAKPMPTVTAKLFAGIKVSPSLTKIVLNADDTATAHVKSLLGTHKRTISLQWESDRESEMEDADGSGVAAVEPTKPEMQFQSASWCGICRVAEKLLNEADKKGDLPFKIKKVDVANGVSPPRFRWQDNNGDWWHSDGWHGVKPLIEAWKKSLNGRVQRAGGPVIPFTQGQPDRVSSIGSRSVALWSINGDSTPSRSVLLSHLTNDGIHRGRHDRVMLESLTTEQLRWLHDRDHGN